MLKTKLICVIVAVAYLLSLPIGCADRQNEGYVYTPYKELNGNLPEFTADQITDVSFEHYSELDSLGRCGVATACIGTDIMPTDERESIGQIKPSGWQLVKYDIVDGKYLYNRCHLIGYQLTGENANARNLITGTRYLNTSGMLPFENEVAEYVRKTDNHVMYRVTPVFSGDNLVADGVQIEAYSVEDEGKGVSFNVFCYNIQPGIVIDYATGDSHLSDDNPSGQSVWITYVINKNTKTFHRPICDSVTEMKTKNRQNHYGTRKELIDTGYTPCSRCHA